MLVCSDGSVWRWVCCLATPRGTGEGGCSLPELLQVPAAALLSMAATLGHPVQEQRVRQIKGPNSPSKKMKARKEQVGWVRESDIGRGNLVAHLHAPKRGWC